MNEARKDFLGWTDCLLDDTRSPGEHRAAAHAWCGWAMGRLGLDPDAIGPANAPATRPTTLPTGEAISPQRAALCVREHRRTAVFLQGMAAAIRAARERFPGETLHVVEAGCGPLAPLALPFAARHAPEEVSFTLLDLHEASLEGARQLAEELGVGDSVRAFRGGDAAAVRFAEAERPHVIGCEVLRRALKKEPQVAVTRALAPQLRPGGFFVPERIEIELGWINGAARTRQMQGTAGPNEASVVEVAGRVFELDAQAAAALAVSPEGQIEAGRVTLPAACAGRPLELFTRIRVFREHGLGDFDCSLTMPERLRWPAGEPMRGELRFWYEVSGGPGLRLERRGKGLA